MGVPGMNASGKHHDPRAAVAAWRSSVIALSTQACWSIRMYAACTAATVTEAIARFSQRGDALSPVLIRYQFPSARTRSPVRSSRLSPHGQAPPLVMWTLRNTIG